MEVMADHNRFWLLSERALQASGLQDSEGVLVHRVEVVDARELPDPNSAEAEKFLVN